MRHFDPADVRFGSKADIKPYPHRCPLHLRKRTCPGRPRHVRFVPEADIGRGQGLSRPKQRADRLCRTTSGVGTNETSPPTISASGRGAVALPALSHIATAQAYPSRPVRLIVNL